MRKIFIVLISLLFWEGVVPQTPIRRKIIATNKVPLPLTWYSQAVQVGDTLYISGNLGMNTDGDLVEGITNQTELAMTNIQYILEAAGVSFSNVVKMTIMLANMSDYSAMNDVYGKFLTTPYPARSAFEAGNLPTDALVEIEAVAIIGIIVDDDGEIDDDDGDIDDSEIDDNSCTRVHVTSLTTMIMISFLLTIASKVLF